MLFMFCLKFKSIFLQILYYLLEERKNDLYLTSRRNNDQKIQRTVRIFYMIRFVAVLKLG